jgi:phosphoenolpyruvate carboxykinase (diphosphate)
MQLLYLSTKCITYPELLGNRKNAAKSAVMVDTLAITWKIASLGGKNMKKMQTYRNVNPGLDFPHADPEHRQQVVNYLNVKLATHGLSAVPQTDGYTDHLSEGLVRNFRQKNRLLDQYLPPADQRIQGFLDDYLGDLKDVEAVPRLPGNTFVLDQYGLARELSLPPDGHEFHTDIVHSYRIKQGVLHNPKHDRRTTKGVFHVADEGLPVPLDKKVVPKIAFARLLEAALNPPDDLAQFPFTAHAEEPARRFISLLLKPLVQPGIEDILRERYMEIRFFAPGTLVSNLDFVESIFGNAGDPYIPRNDSALDPAHWTGHTGCIILATHLTTLKKKDLGLPHRDKATERQLRDGMCWSDPDELYNDGTPFKITARDERGIIVTLIADNYFGYSKKEIKTQISYSANLFGMTEEEHAGGALAFPCYNLGMQFVPDSNLNSREHTIKDLKKIMGDSVEQQPEGYAIDRRYPEIIYVPEDTVIDLDDQTARWSDEKGREQIIQVLPDCCYIHPTGYKIHMEQHPGSNAWRLVGTVAEGTLCHKPCTVSGGGKSEISKSIWDAIHFTPFFIADYKEDMDCVEEIINRDYSDRFIDPPDGKSHVSRSVLSHRRSLGSVIKLLTPSSENRDEFNRWLESIPHRIKALVFLVKRFYHEEWGERWREKFSVDVVNGSSGNILKFQGRPVLGSYLRVGRQLDGTGWTHKLRQDYIPSKKVQWEDDISVSVVVPRDQLQGELNPDYDNRSVKFTENCESRFFQRPDEAVNRGYDKQAEQDLSTSPVFVSNFEPQKRERALDFRNHTLEFTEYTQPVRELINGVIDDQESQFFVLSSHPRIYEGAPSKNPRYLQVDPARLNPMDRYIADVGTRLYRKIPANRPVYHPINAVLPGRRNNPPDHKAGIRPLSVYGPIHYQELPELFMDFVASLTGKSPSTTGAGSEGALTKGPFNALVPTSDLNNALLSYILTGYNGFSTAAGFIGSQFQVDHDISLLIPELWSRLSPQEREPKFLIENGYFEKLEDFSFQGKSIHAGRLGYRVTREFAVNFFGRVFDSPSLVFSDEMLKPELQGMEEYVDGINNIVETQQKVARTYIDDGSVEGAIPPLKALLHIMAEGSWEGLTLDSPSFRRLFDRDAVLQADWYRERLEAYHAREAHYLEQEIAYIESVLASGQPEAEEDGVKLQENLEFCRSDLKRINAPGYVDSLLGTIGRDLLQTQ